MKLFATILRWFGRIWCAIAVVAVAVSYLFIFLNDGWAALAEIISPWNFWNIIAVIIAFAPGVGAIMLADKLSPPDWNKLTNDP